jgi:hypothetical protein
VSFPIDDCPHDCSKCSLSPAEQLDCDSVDGRWIEAVAEYASTCDGCGELCHHDLMEMDEETQLGYCQMCIERGNAPESILQKTKALAERRSLV